MGFEAAPFHLRGTTILAVHLLQPVDAPPRLCHHKRRILARAICGCFYRRPALLALSSVGFQSASCSPFGESRGRAESRRYKNLKMPL
jgi:hypothetical protein